MDGFDDDESWTNRRKEKTENSKGWNQGQEQGEGVGRDRGKVGIIYARVSSDRQAEEGHSIDAQIEKMERVAEDLDISLPFEPLKDEGKTGTDFEREGPREILKLATEGKITHVLIVDESRIGRDPIESLYYVWRLRKDYGVKIVTSDGETDVESIAGMAKATVKFLVAGISNREKAKSSLSSRVQSFQEGNWSKSHVPPGYRRSEDGWIEKKDGWGSVIIDIFDLFLQSGEDSVYKKVAERVNEEYGDFLGSPLDSRKAKRILENPVYKGEPKFSGEMVESEFGEDIVVEDKELAFVPENTFERVQEKIRKIEEKHSSNDGTKVIKLGSLIEEFGLDKVKNSVPNIAVLCPDCGERMVQNGQKKIDDGKVKSQNWLCKNCGRQRLAPNEENLEEIRNAGDKEWPD